VTGLPPIDQALLPADIRRGTSADKKTYAAALGFERALVDQMAKTMAETAKPIDGGDSGDGGGGGDSGDQPQDAATSMYTDMLPDQLTDAITANGGLGLARGFYDAMKESGK
jgi:Rod binding domain-containing protein